MVQVQHQIAVEHPRVQKVDVRRAVRPRPGGDHEVIAAQRFQRPRGLLHLQGVGVGEAGPPGNDLHPIALIVAVAGGDLILDYRPRRPEQLGIVDMHLAHGLGEQGVALVVVEQLGSVAQGFAGDGPPMGTAATDLGMGLDDGHPMPGLGQVHGGALAAGAAADHDGVEMGTAHAASPQVLAHCRRWEDGKHGPFSRVSQAPADGSAAARSGPAPAG